ncbi:XRE family transcriptional regulator [Nocardia australiensis]|uniref:XRE family transcriptional regulator n=1 Tax=Nocardia australiensis TaxID=2887191 RepID=UPI001D14F666|nr:XRE family transcriptional regulator [Nocardia australiensis]
MMLPASPGERIRALRELFGFTQNQLSGMTGLGQSWLSDVETQSRDATDAELEIIAKATGTPLSFFHVESGSIPLDSLRFRKLAGASKTMTRRINRWFGESYRVSDGLIAEGKYPMVDLPFLTQESVTDDEINELADQTREALRLAPDAPIPHLTRALERAGIAVVPIVPPQIDGDEAPVGGGHFGASYWGGLGASGLIGFFPGIHGDRQRFTIAHEVGHMVLHAYRPRAADPEAEANKFATALLVPRSRAVEVLSDATTLTDYARIKATWGVSIQALIMRASALELINETRKRSLFVQLSAKGWRKEEPVQVGNESPLLLWTLLSRRFGPKPYRSAADPLAIPPAVLRSFVPTPHENSGRKQPGGSVYKFGSSPN